MVNTIACMSANYVARQLGYRMTEGWSQGDAATLGVRILGGDTALLGSDRAFVVDTLRHHGCTLGVENHPEKNPAELLSRIGDDAPGTIGGDAHGTIGATLDTGWFWTHGYDASTAVHELADSLVYVHLKDLRAVGSHDTCRFGQGVVPIETCVRALQEVGYQGPISIEHEPADSDPTEVLGSNLRLLRGWLR